jgi:hypothetical protein
LSFDETRKIYRTAIILKKMPSKTMDILNTWCNRQTYWRKGRAFKYYSKFIANFTNHTLGILKPKYCSLGLRASHYWLWISVYSKGIAANKKGIDGQWPPLNLKPGISYSLLKLPIVKYSTHDIQHDIHHDIQSVVNLLISITQNSKWKI